MAPRTDLARAVLLIAALLAAGGARAADLDCRIESNKGLVACGNQTFNGPVGILPEQLPAIIKAATDPLERENAELRGKIEDISQSLNVSPEALRAFFRAIGEADVPPEKQAQKLAEIARRYKDLLAQIQAAPGEDPKIGALKQQATAALEAGDLDRADALLVHVQAAQDTEADKAQLAAAATAGQRGDIALTRLRYLDAAKQFRAAAGRVPASAEDQRLAYLDREADALYRQGDEFGDNAALAQCIDRYHTLLAICDPRARAARLGPDPEQSRHRA